MAGIVLNAEGSSATAPTLRESVLNGHSCHQINFTSNCLIEYRCDLYHQERAYLRIREMRMGRMSQAKNNMDGESA